MPQDRGVRARLRSWFVEQWAPRIGDIGARLLYRATLWRLGCLAWLVVMIPVGLALPGLAVAVAVVWVGGSIACLIQSSRARHEAQRAAAAHLPFACGPEAIKLRAVHEFDKWYVDQRRAAKGAR